MSSIWLMIGYESGKNSYMTTESNFYVESIEKEAFAEFKDRGSKFLANAFPISDANQFKLRLKTIKKEHPSANHSCFAYRLGTDKTIFRVSDDGEPSGSAGRPILSQIDSRKVTNVAIVVTRYFGGTLLGVPGLINAYKTAASLVLQMVPIIRKPIVHIYRMECDYQHVNDVMKIVKNTGGNVISNENQLFCVITVAIPMASVNLFSHQVNENHFIQAHMIQSNIC